MRSGIGKEEYTTQPPPQYSQSNEEEPYYILKTNNPYTFYVPDEYHPDHFMPWVHPFTSVISGPTGSGKSVFVGMVFVWNVKCVRIVGFQNIIGFFFITL
jgi:pantothenate kinase-related protein Tda10